MGYHEYKGLDLPAVASRVLDYWQREDTFQAVLKQHEGHPRFVFYEGPPSANGLPGLHHVLARTLKDTICRYKTQKGYLVPRRAGWDTHGLPVELSVEKMLGITKDDIGHKISVEEYNATCRREVMRFTGEWRKLTERMGYWVDLDQPYITYRTQYIETLWYLLQQLYQKGYLYKGKTIQPYSPAAGTGLSAHELNQPGCYREVTDTTAVAQFRALDAQGKPVSVQGKPLYFLAWTTTPWTLPSNTALAVGRNVAYEYVETFNPYVGTPEVVILAKDTHGAYFAEEGAQLPLEPPRDAKAKLPWRCIKECTGTELLGMRYQQLFPWVQVEGRAFEVIAGDFVTTTDGTGIVHIAPTFGADDARVAKQEGIGSVLLKTQGDDQAPMVDRHGRYTPIEDIDPAYARSHVDLEAYRPWAGRYVKSSYAAPDDPMGGELDVDLSVWLKQRGLVFKVGKVRHSYPHCWRTDKPVLYYPLDSWFVKTTAFRDRLLELNATINWKPESTGSGRFGRWLENVVDWNLSRSRFWGTPLPIWATKDRQEVRCIGSIAELKAACEEAMKAGLMAENPLAQFQVGDNREANYAQIDLHRPFVDRIVLVSAQGQPMYREPDLVDVWFDSGAMPYAQLHYPFEHAEDFCDYFPADFIAEGVDQTRGWFYTLHVLSTMLFDSVAFKNIISNGLVLDKQGNKMSKRLGNSVAPDEVMDKYGVDALRWYMLTNAQPWDNLRVDPEAIGEVVRKFFGTLYNTYAFFALYANVDGYRGDEAPVPLSARRELDRWILSELNSLVVRVDQALADYEPTAAGRAIQEFTVEMLSNWYVRLSRKRFWGGGLEQDKLAAYQTLATCLITLSQLMAPMAPFYAEQLYQDMRGGQALGDVPSVHASQWPTADAQAIDRALEQRMRLAQHITSQVLALRRKVGIKVRQPLARIMVPVLQAELGKQLKAVEPIILHEVNVKELQFLGAQDQLITKRVKPDFKKLGPRFGKQMKAVAAYLSELPQAAIGQLEATGQLAFELSGVPCTVRREEVDVHSEDIPGLLVDTQDGLTVALDVTLTPSLVAEGAAREVVNRVQNLRKASALEVIDRIHLLIRGQKPTLQMLKQHADYIGQQTLAVDIQFAETATWPGNWPSTPVELEHELGQVEVALHKEE